MIIQHVRYALSHRKPAAHPTLMRTLFGFGSLGLFLISIVDSSVVPLPIPGSTDIMLVLLAAHRTNGLLLVVCATAGSLLGGYSSYQIGLRGGLPALERYVSPKYLKRICSWVERHAVLAVALPAILPPPMLLSPFIVAAGALKVPLRRFLIAFAAARGARYSLVAWLGYHYGRSILRTWNSFSAEWSDTLIAVLMILILGLAGWSGWRFYHRDKAAVTEVLGRPTIRRPKSA